MEHVCIYMYIPWPIWWCMRRNKEAVHTHGDMRPCQIRKESWIHTRYGNGPTSIRSWQCPLPTWRAASIELIEILHSTKWAHSSESVCSWELVSTTRPAIKFSSFIQILIFRAAPQCGSFAQIHKSIWKMNIFEVKKASQEKIFNYIYT